MLLTVNAIYGFNVTSFPVVKSLECDELWFTFQVRQMCPLFVIGKRRTYYLCHREDETVVAHVQPKATANKPVFGIACKRAVRLAAKVGLIEVGASVQPLISPLPSTALRSRQ